MADEDLSAVSTATESLAPETEAPQTTETPAQETTPERSMDDTMREVWAKHNPNRDQKSGRFARPEGAEQTQESVEQSTEESPDQPESTENAQEQAPEVDLPRNWSGEMKAKLAALGPEHVDIVRYAAQKDKEANDALSRAGQQIKAFEPLRNVVEHYQDSFQRNGITPDEGVSRLLEVERRLANDPKGTIARIAASYRIDLRELAGAQPQQAQTSQQAQPEQSVRERQLEARLAQIESHLTTQQRSRMEQEYAALDQQIKDFAKDQPHFDAVQDDMVGLIHVIKQREPSLSHKEVMARAYEQAIWANPTVRQSILEEQRKAEAGKAQEEARKKAQTAMKAGSINMRSSTGKGTTPRTMDDTLREVAAKHYSV